MSNQIIEPHSDPPFSSNSPTKEWNENQNQNHSQTEINNEIHSHSLTPVKLNDTFRRLIFTIEKGKTIMQGCTNVVSSFNSTTQKPQLQYLGDRKDKVTVELKCAFMQIMNIETVSQFFDAEVFVQAKWQEPALQNREMELNENNTYDPTMNWIPRMTVLNANGQLEFNRRKFTVLFNQKGYRYPVVTLHWRFKGKFREPLELKHFPFDAQDLTIHLSTERSVEEVDLIEDQYALSTVNIRTFQDTGEWNLYEHVETFRDSTTREYVSSTTHPILYVKCRVRRKIGFYMWNIVFIVALISVSTFCMATEEPFEVDRMYNNVTLLMTAFIFKMAIHQSLPTISYLTYLDVYVLVTLVFLGLQIAENSWLAFLGRTISKEEVHEWDKFCIATIALIYIFFHIMFLIYIYCTAYERRRLLEKKDKLYQVKKQHLKTYGVLIKPDETETHPSVK